MKEYYGIMLHESKEYGGVKITRGGVFPTLRAEKHSAGVIIIERNPHEEDSCSRRNGRLRSS